MQGLQSLLTKIWLNYLPLNQLDFENNTFNRLKIFLEHEEYLEMGWQGGKYWLCEQVEMLRE